MSNQNQSNQNPPKVLSLREYKEKRRVAAHKKASNSSPSNTSHAPDTYINALHKEIIQLNSLIKDVIGDYNKRIDDLTLRQDQLTRIIKLLLEELSVQGRK